MIMAADDRLLSALILAVTAMLGSHVVRVSDRSDQRADRALPPDSVEARVHVIAQAIASMTGARCRIS
jgi:hypothetical protein